MQYIRLLEQNPDNLNDAFNQLIELSYIGERKRDDTITAQLMAKRVITNVVENLLEELRKLKD